MNIALNNIRNLSLLGLTLAGTAFALRAQTAENAATAVAGAAKGAASVREDNATIVPAPATQAGAFATPITIPAGSDLRVALEEGSRLKRVGQSVVATLIFPIYVGETLAAPMGTRVEGHVARITGGAKHEHAGRLLRGDFTPPRNGEVALDALVLADGSRLAVSTTSSKGLTGMHEAKFIPKGQKPGLKAEAKGALKPYTAPHKLQRLGEAAFTALPLHPNYMDQGTVYDAVLAQDLTLPQPIVDVSTREQVPAAEANMLHLKLVSDLDSSQVAPSAIVMAEVTQPFYDNDHKLLYPVGSRVEGRVTSAQAARWLHKNGNLDFEFASITMPGKAAQPLHVTLNGLEVAGQQNVKVSAEGGLRGQNSRIAQGAALAGFIGPSIGLADPSQNKTAYSRGGLGRSGFGVIGTGAAQASANSALGLGYYGAAKGFYSAFLAKGTNIVLPANTPMVVRIDQPSPPSEQPSMADTQAQDLTTSVASLK